MDIHGQKAVKKKQKTLIGGTHETHIFVQQNLR
ncbi:unnamed protein product, partial [marine sediment metagenome]